MSTPSESPKFLVYAPDKTDEGAFARRLSVRPQHLEMAKLNISEGFIRVGGALLSPESLNAAPEDKKMVGSAFICQAESLEDVKKKLEADPYYIAGVWDLEKIVILPFIAATPNPFP